MKISPDNVVRLLWAVWLLSWIIAARWSSRTERRAKARSEFLYRAVTLFGALLVFIVRPSSAWMMATIWQPGAGIGWMLTAFALCGLLITWWARIALGRLWSSGVTRKVEHEVITAGPYRVVRHPIYSGIILSILATAAIRGTEAAYLGAALMALGLWIKARVEERFLREELGQDRYDRYARHVPMLVPFLR
jgi:protein-S-isoprenylcysteine O-methyltransferase Ste14